MQKKELWDGYFIFENGNIINPQTGDFLPHRHRGSKVIIIYKDQIKPLDKLLATAFIPNPENYSNIVHLDENIGNNNLDNLAWSPNNSHVLYTFDEKYEVKPDGTIINKLTNEKLIPYMDHNGFLTIKYNLGDGNKLKYVHRLVAEKFLPNPNGYKYLRFYDNDKYNCQVSNLYWNVPKQPSTKYIESKTKYLYLDQEYTGLEILEIFTKMKIIKKVN